jgi:hypothetical protein
MLRVLERSALAFDKSLYAKVQSSRKIDAPEPAGLFLKL